MFDTNAPVYRLKSINEPGFASTIPNGITLLFDRNGDPILPMNLFILKYKDSLRGKHNTSNSYADDLANWVMYCDYRKIDWRSAGAIHLEHYDSILASSVSAITRRRFSKATRSRRVGSVRAFYRFCTSSGFIQDDTDAPHHYRGRIKTSRPETTVKFIAVEDMIKILDCLGPSSKSADASLSRDRTAAEFLFLMGGRVEDAEALTVIDVLNFEAELKARPDRFFVEHAILGKGGVERTALIMRPLVENLVRYMYGTRAAVIENAISRKPSGWGPPQNLFLNSQSSNDRDVGEPCTTDTLSRAFVEAVRAAGLFSNKLRVLLTESFEPVTRDGKWVEEAYQVPKHSIHHLRHTFAAVLAKGLHRHGNDAPFKVVQILLGHAWLSTTVDTYAGPIALDEPSISDAYMQLTRSMDMSATDEDDL
ncbi:hypothetical protein E0H93_37000 [Rhizobium leguminosarum bv. viciae]|uniref:tyrosine-type recombinase/integrase n=1 Tax=Rhizobium leguminosarum TaxID=384 RepID=UPI00103C016F|nr:tyrosine-type recombinase/integrase [Rhizobium leguminosarum]TBY17676.1 hypothetical protein E0H55_37765 [Rhizobium leguminosarum bv. viciae]TCA92473.1 hypothetical protein E0H93_37000 [Rhizobium leguminosarum bv. viciae]